MHPRLETVDAAAIVLAAGLSTRMGRNKLLLPWGDGTVVSRAVDAAIGAGLAPVFLVVGHERDRVIAAVAGRDVVTVVNPTPALGMDSSVAVGFRTARAAGVGAAVLILADMPRITSDMLRALARAHGDGVLTWSRYGEVAAPPMVYGAGLFYALATLQPGGGRALFERHRADGRPVDLPPECLLDLDAPEDVVRARRSG